MKRRPVRMSGSRISARLGHKVVQVLNFSLTGALLELHEDLPIDSDAMLLLARDAVEVSVEARVIRSTPASNSSAWIVAVTFLNPSKEAQKTIPQLVSTHSRGR